MLPAMMAASIAAPIAANIIGGIVSGDDREAAQEAYQQAVAEIMQVGAPPDLSKEIIIQKFQQAGVYSPEIEKNIEQLTSAVGGIQENVQTKQRQAEAADILAKRGRGGFTLEDRAALDKIRQATEGDYQAKIASMRQGLQQRGVAGSGSDLAMQLQAVSDTANRASQQGIDVGALATQRALQSIAQSGQLAGQMRSQDLNYEQLTKGAQDELNRFNVRGHREIQQRNIAEQNRARQVNLAAAQRAQDLNVEGANRELYRQAEAKRQYWQDQLSRASARAGALQGKAGYYTGQADRTQQSWNQMGSGISQGAAAYGGYQSNQEQRDFDAKQRELDRQNQFKIAQMNKQD